LNVFRTLSRIVFHRERLINTRGYFLLLYDNRLFRPELHYIWNRIVNVVFIRRYNTYKYRSGEQITVERIDLNTVYYPSRTRDFTALKYIDAWHDGKLHYGNNHYISKTTNLHGNSLRLVHHMFVNECIRMKLIIPNLCLFYESHLCIFKKIYKDDISYNSSQLKYLPLFL